MRALRWMTAWLLVLAGCGGGSASQADLASYCDAECAWKSRCKTPELDCVAKCHQRIDPYAGVYVGGYFRAAADCWNHGSCTSASGDSCSAAGVLALNEPTRDRDYQACMNARSACQVAKKETFSDDYCYLLPALTDAARDQFASCFLVSCELQRSCAKNALGE
jgi:hypothetical protein